MAQTDMLPTVPAQPALELDVCRLRWVQADRAELVSEAVRAVLDVLAAAPDARPLSPADVVVVVDRKQTGREIVERLGADGIDLVHTFDGQRDRFTPAALAVKATTVHAFKGWESRAAVAVLESASSEHGLRLGYIAMTRLKAHSHGSFLTVVCSDPRLRSFGRSWPEFVEA